LISPFFERGDVGEQHLRRLLVFSYHFPPDRAIGARRWEKFAHFAADRGWGMDVVMRAESGWSQADPRLTALPCGVRVFAVQTRELVPERVEHAVWARTVGRAGAAPATGPQPGSGAAVTASAPPARAVRPPSFAREEIGWEPSVRGAMRAYWAWRDFAQTEDWSRRAARLVARIVRRGVHRAIVTSGPPFMVHEAGRRLSYRTGIPFVMDMRDPWANVERLNEAVASPVWLTLARRHERRAVKQASLVVANTELARRQLVERYPDRDRDILTVMNGADDDPLPTVPPGARFTVAHAGTVYLDRDPRALFVAAARLVRARGLTPREFALSFMGDIQAVGSYPVEKLAAELGVREHVEFVPAGSHAAALEFQAAATMLLVMSGTNMAAIPAKTFESGRFPAWLLALSAPGSATAMLLEGTAADVAAPDDADTIYEVLDRRYEEFARGVRPTPIASDDRFSRRAQARILFDAIETLSPR
jgi:glycosyltransferase involved in cell wall biosynthesis